MPPPPRHPRTVAGVLALAGLAAIPAATLAEHKPPQASPPTPLAQPKDAAARRALERQHIAIEFINRAEAHVRATVSGCTPTRPPAATFTHDPPSADALNTIGILRRPAAEADHVEPSALTHLPAQDIYTDYTRAAHSASGRTVFIVAARNTNVSHPEPPKCLIAAHARLKHLLAGQPRRIRSTALKIFGQLRTGRLHQDTAPQEGIFILSGNAGGGGGSLDDFTTHGTFLATGDAKGSTVTAAVPDGVASIAVTYPKTVTRGPYFKPATYPSTYTRTIAVRDNVVVFTVPRPPEDAFPARMVWRAGDGHVVRVISRD